MKKLPPKPKDWDDDRYKIPNKIPPKLAQAYAKRYLEEHKYDYLFNRW